MNHDVKYCIIILFIFIFIILQFNIYDNLTIYDPRVFNNGHLRELYRYFISKGINPDPLMLRYIRNQLH